MLGKSAAVAVAYQSAAVPAVGFEAAFAVRAMIDGHAMRVDGSDVATGIEVAGGTAPGRDAGSSAMAVEVVGATIGMSHTPAAVRRVRCGGGVRSRGGASGGGRVPGVAVSGIRARVSRVGMSGVGMGGVGVGAGRVCVRCISVGRIRVGVSRVGVGGIVSMRCSGRPSGRRFGRWG